MGDMVSMEAAKIKTVLPRRLVPGIEAGVQEVKCLPALAQAQGQ